MKKCENLDKWLISFGNRFFNIKRVQDVLGRKTGNAGPASTQAGFSLIEIAIALMIIGLVVGGILYKGTSLVDSARLKKTAHQLQQIQSAVMDFRQRYQALPGDYGQAKQNIHPDLINGDYNHKITGDGFSSKSEAFHFWNHLTGAGLWTRPEAENPVPVTPLGGYFTIHYQENPNGSLGAGHWIVLGATKGEQANGPLLTPLEAQQLNQILGYSGDFYAVDSDEQTLCRTKEGYNVAVTKPVCTIYFRLF